MISNYSDFCAALLECGFSMGGGNAKGIFALIPYTWEQQDNIDSPVRWHTGDPDTDPWEWRMRVLEERDDIAYSKLFFGASGFITREWYPYFYAVRRRGGIFEEAYESGTVTDAARRIYQAASDCGVLEYHKIKSLCDFKSEDSGKIARAVVWLQANMYLTMCGRAQKTNKYGEGYGWYSTAFTTVESFWEERNFPLPDLDPTVSYEKIKAKILTLNPDAKERAIERFIKGK